MLSGRTASHRSRAGFRYDSVATVTSSPFNDGWRLRWTTSARHPSIPFWRSLALSNQTARSVPGTGTSLPVSPATEGVAGATAIHNAAAAPRRIRTTLPGARPLRSVNPLLHAAPEDRAGIVGAEGVEPPVGRRVVDAAPRHPLQVEVVRIHEMHAQDVKSL